MDSLAPSNTDRNHAERSARALASARSMRALEVYSIVVAILGATGDSALVLPHPRATAIRRRLEELRPWLQPSATRAAEIVIGCRGPDSLSRWIRRHRDYVARLLAVHS